LLWEIFKALSLAVMTKVNLTACGRDYSSADGEAVLKILSVSTE